MSRNGGRIDRFAQMSKQEELIAKKRLEILERQRTTQLARAVAEAQNLAAKQKVSDDGDIGAIATTTSFEALSTPLLTTTTLEQEEKGSIKTESECLKPNSSLTGKSGKIAFGFKRNQAPVPVSDQPQPKVQNSFCNDGSFLDHFQKIIKKHEQPKPPVILLQEIPEATINPTEKNNVTPNESAIEQEQEEENTLQHQQQNEDQHLQNQILTQHLSSSTPQPVSVPMPIPIPVSVAGAPFAFNPNMLSQHTPKITNYMQQPHAMQAAFFATGPPHLVPPPPPPPTMLSEAIAIQAGVPTPPPPPPPPHPSHLLATLAPLYMIPAPEPIQLNAIPAPKEFDLNAIPKPQLNLEAIQVPNEHQNTLTFCHSSPPPPPPPPPQHQEEQLEEQEPEKQQKQQVFSDNNDSNCIQLPTTIDNLIDLVSENGDEYEDKIRVYRNELHPAMWFLFDKSCEQYNRYRQELNERQMDKDIYEQEQKQKQKQENDFEKHDSPKNLQEYCVNVYANEQIDRNQQMSGIAGVSKNARSYSPQYDGDKYDPESIISGAEIDSDDEYKKGMFDRNRDNIKRRIECRNELSEEERQEREAEEEQEEQRRQEKKKLRKSRWGEKVKIAEDSSSSSGVPTSFGNQNKPVLTAITRSDPALLQYARLNYGSTELSEEDWLKCEEHYKVNLLYQDMMRKREEIDRLARSGKFKYEYDSDEDVEGGTWEHKLRCAEMEATRVWAQALTKQSEGKHHIGDFLPPEELKKFMEQYESKKNNRQPDLSDYKEYKLKEDNIGFQMLQKLGWKEGQGLGTDGAGIVDPVNKGPQREGNLGLGVSNSATPENCDNVYDAYRKRMMLAYRFRPNPLNNPRRAYY